MRQRLQGGEGAAVRWAGRPSACRGRGSRQAGRPGSASSGSLLKGPRCVVIVQRGIFPTGLFYLVTYLDYVAVRYVFPILRKN